MQGDLISRSAVMEMLTNIELSCTPIPMIEAKLQLRDIHCAYDVEKVIKQTHKIFVDELDLVLKPIPDGSEYPEEAYRLLYLNKCVSDAIRNGGKE